MTSCTKEVDEIQPIEEQEILSVTKYYFDCLGGELLIDLNIGSHWSITTNLPEWIEINHVSQTSFIMIVHSNMTESDRRANVRIESLNSDCTITISQKAKGYLRIVDKADIFLSCIASSFKVNVESNVEYNVSLIDNGNEWITDSRFGNLSLPGGSNKLYFDVIENLSDLSRSARIVLQNERMGLNDTLKVIQAGKQSVGTSGIYSDGDVYCIQKSTKGNVNLVFMGDGFLSEHLNHTGYYEQSILSAVNYYFSIEPYSTYREYFNIYMVVAESDTDKIGDKFSNGLEFKQTKFQTAYGTGTEIVCNDEKVFEYALKVSEIQPSDEYFVVVVLNDDKYAGTCYLYPEGRSIALCPMSTMSPPQSFENLIHHEAGGHGFGFLLDEYIYYQSEMPQSRIDDIKGWQQSGYYMNVDFVSDQDKVYWRNFIGLNGYERVGIYEGSYEYQFGSWRCEENSCMNNNIPYYNAYSRWIIYEKIMRLSGLDYSIEKFIEKDVVDYPEDTPTRSDNSVFIPLAEPKWVYE